MRFYVLFLFMLICLHGTGQINIDFEQGLDESWVMHPDSRWSASTLNPLAGQFSLQHTYDNNEAGEDCLVYPLYSVDFEQDTVVWSFEMRYDYNPSSNNHWAIYLASEQSADSLPPHLLNNGICLGVNLDSSDDSLRLYATVNNNCSEIIGLNIDWEEDIGDDLVRFKVLLVDNVNWVVEMANSSLEYEKLGEEFYDLNFRENYFGIYYKYTSSADQKLWMDNLYIGSPYSDTLDPLVDSVEMLSSCELRVYMNEAVRMPEPDNFILQKASFPDSVHLSDEKQRIDVLFPEDFSHEDSLLTIQGICDMEGNCLKDTLIYIDLEIPEEDIIVFNELMVDPRPAVALPDCEYIELYNRGEEELDLTGWEIIVNGNSATIREATLEGGGYLVLAGTSAAALLEEHCNPVAVSSFPSLRNSGGEVLLQNEMGFLVSRLNYRDSWYKEEEKAEGGYALSRIDPDNLCSSISNWEASRSARGGSPGSQNAGYKKNQDLLPPEIVRLDMVNSYQLHLSFNEKVYEPEDSVFVVYPGEQRPYSVFQTSGNALDILFLDEFEAGNYNLEITSIADECKNYLKHRTVGFSYADLKAGDLVVSEVMSDPSPSRGLPVAEYIELYNRSEYLLSLDGFGLDINGNYSELGYFLMKPDSCVIICDSEHAGAFESEIAVMGLEAMPALPNEQAMITLFDHLGKPVHKVFYQSDWHNTDYEKEGGFSLELKNVELPCLTNNWGSSVSADGGSPGVVTKGSSLSYPGDEIGIALPWNEQTLYVRWSQNVHPKQALSEELYEIYPGNYSPIMVEYAFENQYEMLLHFQEPFNHDETYQLKLTSPIYSCESKLLEIDRTDWFSLPDTAKENDIIINEVLFDPLYEGAEFIEFYNRSSKQIDLSGLMFLVDDSPMSLDKAIALSERPFILNPNEYYVICEDVNKLSEFYSIHPINCHRLGNMPALPDNGSDIHLLRSDEQLIDHFAYDVSLHNPLLPGNEGVSLERLHPDAPSEKHSSWHSAAQSVGFATPGYQNSQYVESQQGKHFFHPEKELFSPNQDGRDDLYILSYDLSQPDYFCNAKVFNKNGVEIRQLYNNYSLGSSGFLFWDGSTNEGKLALQGIYVVYIEMYHPSGEVKQEKYPCVLMRD